jgi:hypothetical protein
VEKIATRTGQSLFLVKVNTHRGLAKLMGEIEKSPA